MRYSVLILVSLLLLSACDHDGHVAENVLLLRTDLPESTKILAHHGYGFQNYTDTWLLNTSEKDFQVLLSGRAFTKCDYILPNESSERRFKKEHPQFALEHCFINLSGKNNRVHTSIYANKQKNKAILTTFMW